MRIAVLISGRSVRYEVCLLPILKNSKYDIDLFISINDTPCKYYNIMQDRLLPWLKGFYICPYTIPKNFVENIHPLTSKQCIDGKFLPFNVLSMFFNDANAFNMAKKYADRNKFEYDAYLKFRSDIIADDFPKIIRTDEYKIFSTIPLCFSNCGIVDRELGIVNENIKVPWVSDAVSYANRKSMEIYCKTYDFTIQINQKFDGNYHIHYESCLTQNLYDNKIDIHHFNYNYGLDKNRRIFDTFWKNAGTDKCGDTRINNIDGSIDPLNIEEWETTEHIPVDPCYY